ncbi:MAG: MgtC/SapB family protein [Burkholderiales bacterium]|nr:MgtC/SapB family protein [Burkholderiales bacterium]
MRQVTTKGDVLNGSAFDNLQPAFNLAGSLAVGLVIGLERGWRDRELSEGGRVAGLRTFALSGMLGGLLASLLPAFGAGPLLAGVLGVSILLAVSYREASRSSGNLSITTAVAMLLTVVLGAVSAHGAVALALAAAVIVAVLLNLKPTLHRWLRLVEHQELSAALQLLVLSVVILPYLPNVGFGPYEALNPYQLWWSVVLIAGLSLAGHLAMRATGPHRGILWTGILGGLASSTATTLALARYARQNPSLARAAATGIVAACGVMFFRMAVLAAVIQPGLMRTFGLPLLLPGMALLVVSLWQWRQLSKADPNISQVEPMAPFDLGTALGFGAYLAVIAVLVPITKQWLGASGLYILSAASGLADVDAIVISVARLHGPDGLPVASTILALSLAALANMVAKASMAWVTGGASVGWPVLRAYGVGAVLGFVSVALALT